MTPQQLKAMKMALEALEYWDVHGKLHQPTEETITALEEVLKEHAMREVQRLGQEIEPDDIASILACRDMLDAPPVPPRTWVGSGDLEDSKAYLTPPQRTEQEQQIETLKRCLFQMQEAAKDLVEQAKSLTPPQRTWVGLTDEQIEQLEQDTCAMEFPETVRAIEAAHGIKGGSMNWLPAHKCGLYLSHNEHKDVYESIEDFYDYEDFISPEEWHKAVAEDSVWVLRWYPDTPIGFYRVAASTLEAIEAKLKEKNT